MLPPPQQDRDIGLSVKTRYFCEHPRTLCVGAEAEDCNLSGYTNVYINGRIGDILILGTHKYKKRLHHNHRFKR